MAWSNPSAQAGAAAAGCSAPRLVGFLTPPQPLWATSAIAQSPLNLKKIFVLHLNGSFCVSVCVHHLLSCWWALLGRIWLCLLYLTRQVRINSDQIPPSLLCCGLKSPSSLSLSSGIRCPKPLSTVTVLGWARPSMSTSRVSLRQAQNQTCTAEAPGAWGSYSPGSGPLHLPLLSFMSSPPAPFSSLSEQQHNHQPVLPVLHHLHAC